MSGTNRPFKYGEKDRRVFITQDSEVAFRAENDVNGNPVYIGRAKVGVGITEAKWQIAYVQYDGNQAVTSVTWPQNAEGNASSEYEFIWNSRATYTYS